MALRQNNIGQPHFGSMNGPSVVVTSTRAPSSAAPAADLPPPRMTAVLFFRSFVWLASLVIGVGVYAMPTQFTEAVSPLTVDDAAACDGAVSEAVAGAVAKSFAVAVVVAGAPPPCDGLLSFLSTASLVVAAGGWGALYRSDDELEDWFYGAVLAALCIGAAVVGTIAVRKHKCRCA